MVLGRANRRLDPVVARNVHRVDRLHACLAFPIADYGDALIDPLSTERSVHEIRKYVAEIAGVKLKNGKHTIPIIIGGDHSLSYPNIAGSADVYGNGNVGVIHFDAHYDAAAFMGHLITHGAWVKRLIEEGHVPGKNYLQVGLYYPGEESFDWMRKKGVTEQYYLNPKTVDDGRK